MRKSRSSEPSTTTGALREDLASLVDQVRSLVQSARKTAADGVNSLHVLTNFEIGRLIVEHEQQGAARAVYGTQAMRQLAARLTEELGKGFAISNVQHMRSFFLLYQDRLYAIHQTPSGDSAENSVGETGSSPFVQALAENSRRRAAGSATFSLSWSHYVLLLGIKDKNERNFYEIEASQGDCGIL